MFVRSERGLTLVELSVVLLILGILLYSFVPGLSSVFDRTNRDVVEIDMRTVKTEIANYYIEHRYLPKSMEDVLEATGMRVYEDGELDGVKKYVTEGREDSWGNSYYMYIYEGDVDSPSYFSFVSAGPDGKLSGSINDVGDDIIYLYFPVK